MTRNALAIGEWIVTTDNSAAIGQKALDQVVAPDQLTAKFAARVALLEQWAAGSEPEAVLLHNFSGSGQWARYVAGIKEVFEEAGLQCPPISGSSETNMETMQSAVAVTMFGKRERETAATNLKWFLYGVPLIGDNVLIHKEGVADLRKIRGALESGLAEHIWPVGSGGIAEEAERMLGRKPTPVPGINFDASGGPGTCVLVGVAIEKADAAGEYFGKHFVALQFG